MQNIKLHVAAKKKVSLLYNDRFNLALGTGTLEAPCLAKEPGHPCL